MIINNIHILTRNLSLLFALLIPALSYSQTETDTVLLKRNLNPLVVSAERNPTLYSQAMRVVQVINREEIRQLPVQSLDKLLEFVSNVDIRNRGTFGMQSDASIRGGSFDQTLILLNGVNLSDPQTGHHNLDLPVDLASIERIEILQGPGARIFGPNAFNGAINIITSGESKQRLSASAMGGEHVVYRFSANAAFKLKNTRHSISTTAAGSDGYIENTDFKSKNIYYSGGLKLAKSSLEIQGGYTIKDFGANSFYTPKYPNQFEATRTAFASASLKPLSGKGSLSVYWRRHHDRFELFRNSPPSWYAGHNYHRTDVFGSNGNYLVFRNRHWKSSIGYDFRYEKIISNKLGDSLPKPIAIPGEEKNYIFGKERLNAGLFAEQGYYNGKFSLSGGLLMNYHEMETGRISVYPGIDAGYEFARNYRLYITANRTLRMPTFTDLYYNDPSSSGNPELKPEEAYSFETGVKYSKRGINGQILGFRRYGKNMIDWVKEAETDKWQAMNLTNVTLSGFEVSGNLQLAEITSNNYPVKSISFGYCYLSASKSSDDYLSRYVLDILQHKADLRIVHSIYKGLSASWSLSWQDRLGGYIPFEGGIAGTTEVPYAPYFLLDGRLSYTFKRCNFYIDANNLLNESTVDFGNVPQPGRWIMAGVRVDILK